MGARVPGVQDQGAVDPQPLAVVGDEAQGVVAAGVDAELSGPADREVVGAGQADVGGAAVGPVDVGRCRRVHGAGAGAEQERVVEAGHHQARHGVGAGAKAVVRDVDLLRDAGAAQLQAHRRAAAGLGLGDADAVPAVGGGVEAAAGFVGPVGRGDPGVRGAARRRQLDEAVVVGQEVEGPAAGLEVDLAVVGQSQIVAVGQTDAGRDRRAPGGVNGSRDRALAGKAHRLDVGPGGRGGVDEGAGVGAAQSQAAGVVGDRRQRVVRLDGRAVEGGAVDLPVGSRLLQNEGWPDRRRIGRRHRVGRTGRVGGRTAGIGAATPVGAVNRRRRTAAAKHN